MVGASRPPSNVVAGGIESELLPSVRHVVAVASGKGGVGKSTVAVNLAVALAREGASVGLLDADVYGPSIPLMLGQDGQPRFDAARRLAVPFERHGIRFMSLGFLAPREEAIIWRGPMVMKAIDELLRNVDWGELDVLVVDMPPGTGDAQLTLSQKIRLAGAVIVTTPQDVALADAIKGIAMFRKVGVPILGLVENMSHFACPHCGERSEIFGHGGGRRQAERLDVPFLGEIPLDAAIRDGGDTGRPVAAEAPGSAQAEAFCAIARRVASSLGLADAEPPSSGADRDRPGLLGRLRDTLSPGSGA
jgi:ATP-binding protein involved in chromosome partitioning